MSTLEVNTVDSVGSTLTLGSSNANTLSLNSGITTLPATLTNTPAFFAKLSGNQTISTDTITIVQFDTEVYDTDSAFDTSNYRFTVPSGKAGKYVFTAHQSYSNSNNSTATRHQIYFYKNGSVTDFHGDLCQAQSASADPSLNFTTQLDLAAGDYVDVRVNQNASHNETLQSAWSRFFGYRLIGA